MDLVWHALEATGNILLRVFWTVFTSTEFASALGGVFFGAFLAAWFESKRSRSSVTGRSN
jgi:hypothetical protein